MTRWLLVGAVLLLTALALAGVRGFRPESDVLDELLAYEVKPAQGVVARIPGGLPEISITSWAVVEPHTGHTPASRYSYALDVTVLGEGEVRLVTQRMEITSRISGDPRSPRELGEYAARLVDGSAWLTDPRTQRVDVAVLRGKSGYVGVRPAPSGQHTVLVRLGYEESRTSLERQIVERRLRPDERRRLLGRSYSLGFSDLPAVERDRTLATWGRRIVAVGREGKDYVSRGLLVGDYRDAVALERAPPVDVDVGPKRRAVINLRRRVKLRIHGSPGTRLEVLETPGQGLAATIDQRKTVDLMVGAEGPRSISIAAERPSAIRFSAAYADGDAQIGEVEHAETGNRRVWLVPDVVVHRYVRLDPSSPVRVRIARQQPMVGITLRALVEETGESTTNAELRVAYVGESPGRWPPPYVVDLASSQYESTDVGPVTESRVVLVRPPRDVQEIELAGPRWTILSVWTEEPGVRTEVLDARYDVPLDETQVWRHAPAIERNSTTIRPTNEAQLEADGRIVRVAVQPRIEAPGPGPGERIAERVALPLGHPIARHVLRPSWYARGTPVPETAWTRLETTTAGTQRRSVLTGKAQIRLAYRTTPDRLGRVVRVEVAGREPSLERILSTVGELTFGALPGETNVAIEGLLPTDEAWLSAVPSTGGRVYTSQRVYELPRDKSLTLRFERRPGELLALLISLASEKTSGQFEVSYQIDPGQQEETGQRVYRRLTQMSGVLRGELNSARRVLIWESDRKPAPNGPLPHALGVVRIPLGDDLRPGIHRVRLTFNSAQSGPLWVRAVTAGRVQSSDWGTDE